MTPELIKEILGFAGFAWGIYSWVLSRRDKIALEQRTTITDQLKTQSLMFTDKLTDQKADIAELKREMKELQQQMASVQAQVEDLKSLTKSTESTVLESAQLLEKSIGNWTQSFGKVIVKD